MTQKNQAGVMLAAARATLLLSLLEPDKSLRECAAEALADEEGAGVRTWLEPAVLELARSLLAEALDTAPWSVWLPAEAERALERQRDEREQGATAP